LLHQITITSLENKSKTSKAKNNLGKSLIKSFKFSEEELKDLKIEINSNTALEEINKKIDSLKISKINTLKNEEHLNKISKRKKLSNTVFATSQIFYNISTLPDIQFEEWELEHSSVFYRNRIPQ